jgi:hypothetical protein
MPTSCKVDNHRINTGTCLNSKHWHIGNTNRTEPYLGSSVHIATVGHTKWKAAINNDISSAPVYVQKKKKTPWCESAIELYRPSDRLLSAKLLPTFADRGCHVVSVTDPYGCILGFLQQLLFYQVAPQLYSRGWVDPVPDPLLFFLFFLVLPGIEPGPPDL